MDDGTRARLEQDRLHAQRVLVECAENRKRYPWVTLMAQDYLDLLAAYDALLAEREQAVSVLAGLDCKTPKCPQARTVMLDGPTPDARYGGDGLCVRWYCGSCESVWTHWERAAREG